jgi:hypothetical protein
MGIIWRTRWWKVKEMMTPKWDSKTGRRILNVDRAITVWQLLKRTTKRDSAGLGFVACDFRPETYPFRDRPLTPHVRRWPKHFAPQVVGLRAGKGTTIWREPR